MKFWSSLIACVGAAALGAPASAALVPVFESATLGGLGYAWTYHVDVDADARVEPGDYVTLYDFLGYNGNSALPAGWSLTSDLAGPTPFTTMPNDDLGIPNITFVYAGSVVAGPTDIGPFVVYSDFGGMGVDSYAADATRATGNLAGQWYHGVGSVAVPTPEPTAGAALLLGGLILGVRRR